MLPCEVISAYVVRNVLHVSDCMCVLGGNPWDWLPRSSKGRGQELSSRRRTVTGDDGDVSLRCALAVVGGWKAPDQFMSQLNEAESTM